MWFVMNPVRQILVPTDFSEPSQVTLDYAAALARSFDASVDVLHVWEVPAFVPPTAFFEVGGADTPLVEIVRKSAESKLGEFIADAKKRGVQVRASFAELGAPSHVIAEFARTRGYDLIVIGTHGRTGLSHALIGSVAERVVRHASCPVLAVRQPASAR